MNIRLVPNGIFPIIFDKDGKKLDVAPKTRYSAPGTIQGEGKLAGVPSLFIRLWGCNLDCKWMVSDSSISQCDTQESLRERERSNILDIEDVAKTIEKNCYFNGVRTIHHIVITGGEPLLQADALEGLITLLKRQNLHITLETNGTIYHESIFRQIDLLSVSPKLSVAMVGKGSDYIEQKESASLETAKSIVRDKKRGAYNTDLQFKFVLSSRDDMDRIYSLFNPIILAKDAMLMPLGGTKSVIDKSTLLVAEIAVETGWRYSPRLHVDLWGDISGV